MPLQCCPVLESRPPAGREQQTGDVRRLAVTVQPLHVVLDEPDVAVAVVNRAGEVAPGAIAMSEFRSIHASSTFLQ